MVDRLRIPAKNDRPPDMHMAATSCTYMSRPHQHWWGVMRHWLTTLRATDLSCRRHERDRHAARAAFDVATGVPVKPSSANESLWISLLPLFNFGADPSVVRHENWKRGLM